MSFLNSIVNEFDIALKTISNKKSGTNRVYPPMSSEKNTEELTQKEKNLSIQMMRVNLAGEVAAQALYRGQALVCRDPEIKKHLIEAGEEETDHLVWCKKRLDELLILSGMQVRSLLVPFLETLVKKLVLAL